MGSKITGLVALLFFGLMTVVSAQEKSDAKSFLGADGEWKERYDVVLDGEVKGETKEFRWKLSVRNLRITGIPAEFKEGDAGTDHRLSGEVVDGEVAVVSLRQDGPKGYVRFLNGKCSEKGRIVGTWYDTSGRSGDFEFVAQGK
jgi:hypothetical protein